MEAPSIAILKCKVSWMPGADTNIMHLMNRSEITTGTNTDILCLFRSKGSKLLSSIMKNYAFVFCGETWNCRTC
jgi:hypothetical protein